jgi:hypothetical protein
MMNTVEVDSDCVLVCYSGKALTDPNEPPIHIFLDPPTYEGLQAAEPAFWWAIIAVLEADAKHSP